MRALVLLLPALVSVAYPGPAPLASAGPIIEGVPHVKQKPDFCGEACVAMVLGKLGRPADQDRVFDASGLDPTRGRGCHTAELVRAVKRLGFRPGEVWRQVKAGSAAELAAEWKSLVQDLKRSIPSIICMRYSEEEGAPEHFRLVLGYDPEADEVIYHEPALEDGSYRRMKRESWLPLWPLKYERERWTVIRIRMEPGELRTEPAREGFTSAHYAQHVRDLKKRLPGADFSIHLEPPFVVVGDGPPARVARRTKDTVRWAVEQLKEAYFGKDPEEILTIWLFKDKESYEKHVKEVFGKAPTTPFGYYSAQDRALVMNIDTGGGTLVHEIVHPFMSANFPECPAWFNEGLASLYEQSGEKGGRIHGYTNWRLAGLKEAIRAGNLSSFRSLTSSGDGFYGPESGINYAQARYLSYYLQEKGLLRKYYREFHTNRKDDPTGYRALKKVLGKKDEEMPAFEKEWSAFVLGLSFP